VNTKVNFNEEFKMVLVVRNDLKMGKGKAAAQVKQAEFYNRKWLFLRISLEIGGTRSKDLIKCFFF